MSKERYGFPQRDKTIAGVGAAAVAVVVTKIIKDRHDKASKENKENYTADAKSRAAEKQEA
ncbi:MAG: hypothetical protein KAI83_06950 [Thiomargarita sp.]|nr:hypothetical protein [Thiomargarita sp.]